MTSEEEIIQKFITLSHHYQGELAPEIQNSIIMKAKKDFDRGTRPKNAEFSVVPVGYIKNNFPEADPEKRYLMVCRQCGNDDELFCLLVMEYHQEIRLIPKIPNPILIPTPEITLTSDLNIVPRLTPGPILTPLKNTLLNPTQNTLLTPIPETTLTSSSNTTPILNPHINTTLTPNITPILNPHINTTLNPSSNTTPLLTPSKNTILTPKTPVTLMISTTPNEDVNPENKYKYLRYLTLFYPDIKAPDTIKSKVDKFLLKSSTRPIAYYGSINTEKSKCYILLDYEISGHQGLGNNYYKRIWSKGRFKCSEIVESEIELCIAKIHYHSSNIIGDINYFRGKYP